MQNIDLRELSNRESERVEWKREVASIDDIVRTAVAFANDFSNLGGGYIVCGAEETKDEAGFQKVEFPGLSSSRLKEVEGKFLADCREHVDPPIVPFTEELPTADPSRRVLVFVVPATENAHCYRSSGKDASTYYIRIGRETREARNGLLRELLVRKKALDPWDRRVNRDAGTDDFDLLTLREYLQTMGLWEPNKPVEEYLSPDEPLSAFVPPLTGRDKLTDVILPRNFALLMFCMRPTRFFPGAYSVFSVYPGVDRGEPVAERIELTGTIVEQARRLAERLNIESFTAFDKTSTLPNLQKYPTRALQEAVVNALVHRDYESDQPVRVTVFLDRVEISSPGSLPRVVNHERFERGQATAYWRNQALAYFFNKLQLAQAEGQGIPTILRTMREAGCPVPRFEIGLESVLCVLPAHPRHSQLRQLRKIENDLILGNREQALRELEQLLGEDPYNFRSIELFCEACRLAGEPQRVFEFFVRSQVKIEGLNPASLIIAAETLLLVDDRPDVKRLAERFLKQATAGRIEESEVKRLALAIRKIGNNEQAVQFIDETLSRVPQLAANSSLLEIRARAKMDLAKSCMDTAKNGQTTPRLQARAWDQCRVYLSEAGIDLQEALEHNTSPFVRDFIENDLKFLDRLRAIAKKPPSRRH